MTTTPFQRRAFCKALASLGISHQRTAHGLIREMIYLGGAVAPLAVGMAVADPGKKWRTVRTIAVVESVALLAIELLTHRPAPNGQGRTGAFTRSRPFDEFDLKREYRAAFHGTRSAADKTVGR